MQDDTDWERLARYVSGEASTAERSDIERWAAEDAGRRALLDSLARRWRAAGGQTSHDVDAAWARFATRLAQEPRTASVVALESRRRTFYSVRRYALAAAVVLAAGIAFWRLAVPGTGSESLGTGVLAAGVEIRTQVGERRSVDLADGSHVVLGARSALRLDPSFGTGARRVYLEGQALFRVTHDSTRPFFVHAAGTVAEDLGTEFEVRAYAGEDDVRVIVAEGSVGVRQGGSSSTDSFAVLRPRDVGRFGSGGPVVLHDQDIDRLMGWTNGNLVFDDVPLSRVAQELERWFDVECRITDQAIANRLYSGPFFADSLDAGLQALDVALEGVRVERRGRIITFSTGTSALPHPPQPGRVEAGG